MADIQTMIADRILVTAVWGRREGNAVCEADRDSEEYLWCQEAADEIIGMFASFPPALREEIARTLHDANTGKIVPDDSDPTKYAEMSEAMLGGFVVIPIQEVRNAAVRSR